jgi:hypothetical protein
MSARPVPSAGSKNPFDSKQKAGRKVAPEPEQERISLVIRKRAGAGLKVRPSALKSTHDD